MAAAESLPMVIVVGGAWGASLCLLGPPVCLRRRKHVKCTLTNTPSSST